MSDKPILGITMGDPANIGPEIAIKALLNQHIYDICQPLLVGDAGVFKHIVNKLNLPATINAIQMVNQAKFQFGVIDVLDLQNVDIDKLEFGVISPMAGNAAFTSVAKVIELAMKGEIDVQELEVER